MDDNRLEDVRGSVSESLAETKLAQLEASGAFVDFYGAAQNQFKLNGDVFEVIEDENDGYRSSLGTIIVDDKADQTIFFETPVAQVRLQQDDPSYEPYEDAITRERSTWSLVDRDGHVWLQYGTDNTDDYYPSFVFRYSPKESSQSNPTKTV